MIPSTNSILTVDLQMLTQPSKQHRMQLDGNRIKGTCEGIEALKQTIYKILNTERYAYIIYSWNYGIELMDLYGKPVLLVCAEAERRIKDALSVDDRITGVDSFEFDTSVRKIVSVSFTVHSVYGDINERMVVNY